MIIIIPPNLPYILPFRNDKVYNNANRYKYQYFID